MIIKQTNASNEFKSTKLSYFSVDQYRKKIGRQDSRKEKDHLRQL